MNHDGLSSSASPSTPVSASLRQEHHGRQQAETAVPAASASASGSSSQAAQRRKSNRQAFNRKRAELLDELLRSIDLLVYSQLSTIYYLDCSFLPFVLRALVQLILLTPKPFLSPGSLPSSQHRPYIGAILGSNFLCVLLHTVLRAPSAGEATRGYLHGGVLMDFIGQRGPTGKAHLLGLDVLVLGLQLVGLAVHIMREDLKQQGVDDMGSTSMAGRAYTSQTVEDEERGVRRSQEDIPHQELLARGQDQDPQSGIEMQLLSSRYPPPADPPLTETSTTRATTSSATSVFTTSFDTSDTIDARISDAFNSGQIVLADLDVARTVRQQFWAYQLSPVDREPVAAGRQLGARLAAGIVRWRFGGAG